MEPLLHAPPTPTGLGGCLVVGAMPFLDLNNIVYFTLILHAPSKPTGLGGCLVECALH